MRRNLVRAGALAVVLMGSGLMAQQTTAAPQPAQAPSTTQPTDASAPPMSKGEMKDQRKQQKANEKAAKAQAKSAKSQAKAMKAQDKATDDTEKAQNPK